ncbi:helix-turn-helix transcriptional regulator [Variovorax saccharolyticus]|uniref:helix-turn-helix transcriptional regulator n=1 Tax=Variovorax saccharolyticus TaxID=3053516 RepID=UPI00257890A8|nr:LuxR family transcriptional regulator [Variovorax sp. J31P216]MDM0026081.1 LuxR C-terminal-related transcriptional regulator [Variovorax sp. J31P216]
MQFVPLAATSGLAAAGGPSANSLALAGLIGSVGADDFSRRALAHINRMLPVCWWSVYRLHEQGPPEIHLNASFEARDRTAAAFRVYRQGLYRADRSFDPARQTRPGASSLTHLHAEEISRVQRREIYTANGLRERVSLVRRCDDGSLLALNLYRNESQCGFQDNELALLQELGAPLIACVELQLRLSCPAAAPVVEDARPLLGLPRREREVCERLLMGWTYDGVAADLGLSAGTVKTYRDRAFERLGIHHRNELFAMALAHQG